MKKRDKYQDLMFYFEDGQRKSSFSENFCQIKTIKTLEKRQKTTKKATKKRQIVAFSFWPCSFLSPPKKATKLRQKRQFVAFSFCRRPPQFGSLTAVESLDSSIESGSFGVRIAFENDVSSKKYSFFIL